MEFIRGWDEPIYKKIAAKCSNEQVKRDVQYFRFVYFHNPNLTFCERISEIGFTCAVFTKDFKTMRFICTAVAKEERGKGYGQMLVFRAMEHAKKMGANKTATRTYSGVKFYQNVAGMRITAKKGNDFIMEGIL